MNNKKIRNIMYERTDGTRAGEVMKKILVILLFSYSNNCYSQQLLMKVELESKTKVGWGVEMYYLFDSISQLKNELSKIAYFTEPDLLNGFSKPLVEPLSVLDVEKCFPFDNLQKENTNFLKKYRKSMVEKGNLIASISISYVSVEYCMFDLYIRYWAGGYNIWSKKAAVIISYKKHSKKISKSCFREIIGLFETIP